MTMRVLVFDDDAAIGRLVARIATGLGMEGRKALPRKSAR
jgi:hypothetical protein